MGGRGRKWAAGPAGNETVPDKRHWIHWTCLPASAPIGCLLASPVLQTAYENIFVLQEQKGRIAL